MKFIRLSLHVSYKEKDYSVLYYIILQVRSDLFNPDEQTRARILREKKRSTAIDSANLEISDDTSYTGSHLF